MADWKLFPAVIGSVSHDDGERWPKTSQKYNFSSIQITDVIAFISVHTS